MTSDLDDAGYATGNFKISVASGDPDDGNRNINLASPRRAIVSKHKLTGNFPTYIGSGMFLHAFGSFFLPCKSVNVYQPRLHRKWVAKRGTSFWDTGDGK